MTVAKKVETAPGKAEPVGEAPKPAGAAPAARPAAPATAKPKRGRGRLLMISVPLLVVLAGGYVWLTGGRYVTTDNAYVHQPIVAISSDVDGRIVAVEAQENTTVEAGTPVFRLDPEPYQIALSQAQAALASAKLQVEQLRAAYATAEGRLASAQTIWEVQKREMDRQKSLLDRGLSTGQALDSATVAARSAENDMRLARDEAAAAAAALGGDPKIATDDFPAVQAAEAARAAAARDLAKATVMAPVTGILSQTGSLNVGQYVTTGAMVASLVQSGDTWVEANLKETQLDGVRVGQPVAVEVDAYSGVTLKGEVESIGSATGSAFALIPAQNATGNWVKVVQRLPVRIRIDADPDHPLRDGMSATVSVDTGHSRMDGLF